MNFFNQLNTKQLHILKLVGIGLVAIILLAFVGRLFGSSFSSFAPMQRLGYSGSAGYPAPSDYYGKMAGGSADGGAMPELSIRNINPSIAPVPTQPPTGNEAEAYEVRNYRGVIETNRLEETCGKIAALKTATYIVFENAHQADGNCDYTFKVERNHVDEVLTYVKALQPKDLSENTHTIKRTIDDFTSEVDILQKKKATIEKTLEDATRAYDEITAVATRAQDANSLSNIITSKLQIIERLTEERINISEQLDRLARAKAEQLDRLDYTYFSLAVYENKYLDGDSLKESWKNALRTFVQDLNKIAQDLSITLIALFFLAIQYIIYFFILLVIIKYVWRGAKYVWKK